jgi:thioredoxin reductase
VTGRAARVIRARRETAGTFVVETADGRTERGRRLLLATGVEDICPSDVGDFDRYYGSWIYHCPDCDGYQATGRKIGLICWGRLAAPYAMEFLNWTREITILANGHAGTIPADHWRYLDGWGIPVEPRGLVRFEGRDGRLTGVRLDDGTGFPCEVVYFYLGQRPRNELAKQLGCRVNSLGHIEQDERQRTSEPGVFTAGDVAPPDQSVAVAVAQGQVAAITLNRSLYERERWMG